MRMSIYRTLFVSLAVAISVAASAQDTKTVLAEGFGGAKDNLRARDDAINDALRRAVEQGVGTFVDAGTLSENYELVADTILTKAAGYVQTYEIIDETMEEDLLRVTIRAVVALAPLKDDLIAIELLKQRLGYPRVMVIGVERMDGGPLDSRTVATSIENFLVSKNFDLVDAEYTELGKARDAALAFDDYAKAQALGQRFGAEVMVVYEADADYNGSEVVYGTMFERYRSSVNARMIKVDTAALMGSIGSVEMGGAGGRAGGARKALENAGDKIAPKIFDKIVATWERDVEGGTRLELIVSGIDFKTSNDIYLDLQELRGVKSVGTPQMVRNTVTYQIKGELQGFGLAQRLAQNFPDIEIEEVTQNRVKAAGKE